MTHDIREDDIELTTKPVVKIDGRTVSACTDAEVEKAVAKLLRRIETLRLENHQLHDRLRQLGAD